MKNILLGFFCLLCLGQTISQTIYKEFADGKVYVKLTKSAMKQILRENPNNIPLQKMEKLSALFAKYGVNKVSRPFHQASDDAHLPSILRLEFSQAALVREFINELQSSLTVEYAEKVRLNKVSAVPNDPLFASAGGSVHLNQINAQNAWNIYSGNSNITVAVVDNAVMWTHADLAPNTYTNSAEASGVTGVDDDGNGYVDDINGFDVASMDNVTNPTNLGQDHGTHCAGIAGGATNNSAGIASIGWNVKLIPVKCSFDNSPILDVDFGYEGIIYAVRAKAKIISCSWGNQGAPSATEQYCIDYAWNRGCIIIASAGNYNNTTPNYPGAYNHVYCVAAVNASDVKWSLSCYGSWVDISAPGDNILSTLPYTGTPAYGQKSGTSMATPLVAGLAALMLSKSPNMTRMDVLNCISTTAVNISTLSGNSSYTGGLGAGRIEAFQAMTCASTFSALPPVANFYAFPIQTCPNTLVPFTDSSLYQPTSWSWVFQGGTPAASTSSNPVVQWTTPGTYSVSLTVSNPNGSSTKTKLAYVTVAGAQSLPFTEGFQSLPFLPPGWSPNNIWNDNLYWTRATGLGGFGTSTACAVYDNFNLNAPGERDEMRSPKFDLSNVANVKLRFDVAYARFNASFSDTLEVKLSTDCGTSWTSIYLKGGTALSTSGDQGTYFTPSASQWRVDSVDVSPLAAGQGNVMFSFINRGHYGQPIYLDNINLFFPSPTLSATYPGTVCAGETFTLNNTSTGAASYTWNLNGALPATSTATSPVVSFAGAGTYTISMSAVNGTSSKTYTSLIQVSPLPLLAIAASPANTICAGSTLTLSASGANTYSWSTGGTGNILAVSPLAYTVYSVTGFSGGCAGTETIGIFVTPSTVNISISANPPSGCPGVASTLTGGGANNYTWLHSGATASAIIVSPQVTTTYTLSGDDGNCKGQALITVTVIPEPLSVVSASNPLCVGDCNGIVNASTTGGPLPYSYSLSAGNCTTLPCTNLCGGFYQLTTTNGAGCSSTVAFTLTAPAALQGSITSSNAGCVTCPDGTLQSTITGGSAPYTYSWSPNGGNAATATGLLPGCYTLSVEDSNHCLFQSSACVISNTNTGLLSAQLSAGLSVYPNPAKNSVNIACSGNFFYAVYTALGQKVRSAEAQRNLATVNTEGLARGLYIVEIYNGSASVQQKLILE